MTEAPSAPGPDLVAIEARRRQIRDQHLRSAGERPSSSARGLHHAALISEDVERTVRFYQDLLAFFDFPGLDLTSYHEVLGEMYGHQVL